MELRCIQCGIKYQSGQNIIKHMGIGTNDKGENIPKMYTIKLADDILDSMFCGRKCFDNYMSELNLIKNNYIF